MKKDNQGNIFDILGKVSNNNYYKGKVVDGEWTDPAVSNVKGKFKWYLLVIAVLLVAGTVVNFNYLGGVEGIRTAELLVTKQETLTTYVAGVGSLVVLPALAVICLVLAFKKRK